MSGGTGKDKGFAKIKNRKPIHGIGINDFYKSTIDDNGKCINEYTIWKSMFTRCYSKAYQSRQPTYKECHVDEYFHSFTNFYNFIHNLCGYGELDDKGKLFQLDKDILLNKSKCYSPDTICFVPRSINNVLVLSNSIRGDCFIGVCKDKKHGTFASNILYEGKRKYLGTYKTEIEAFNVYKNFKENYINHLAEKWKNKIDIKVYDALKKYKINIDD